MIDIQKIVQTNFNVVQTQTTIGSYKKVLFVCNEQNSATHREAGIAVYTGLGGNSADITTIIIPNDSKKDDSQYISDTILSKKKQVSGTDDDFIFVCLCSGIVSTASSLWSNNGVLAKLCAFSAPYKVIPCVTAYDTTNIDHTLPVAVKLGNGLDMEESAMAIPAYFSKIELDKGQSLKDYCYTEEKEIDENYSVVQIADTDYEAYVSKYNFLNKVGNKFVNFGGNLVNGVSITAQFGAIAVENDIIKAVLNTMLKKQYLNNQGLNNIISAINDAMTRYTYNGFLEQNGVYTGETYVDTYTTPATTLIKKGVILPEGYYVARIPMSKLTMNDRHARKFTPIRIFMQTLSGARVVEIDGTIVD